MAFRPKVNDKINLDSEHYLFTEHPSAPGMPYGQTGRRATVYQLEDQQSRLHAIKVFNFAYRSPQIETQAYQIARYASLPGLSACQRQVLSPTANSSLINAYPDLRYAVLMPWIQGTTWQELMIRRQSISRGQSLMLAESLLRVLATLEHNHIAHSDLSGPNVIVDINNLHPSGNGNDCVALIDLEDLYAPGLQQPERLPAGSAGYAHRSVKNGVWEPQGDRFAGTVLLAEMLCWCDEHIREASFGEQYFDLSEVQQTSDRKKLLVAKLTEYWGANTAKLFERAWESDRLEECPTFAEWAAVMKISIPQAKFENVNPPVQHSLSADSPLKGWRSFSGKTIETDVIPTSPRLAAEEFTKTTPQAYSTDSEAYINPEPQNDVVEEHILKPAKSRTGVLGIFDKWLVLTFLICLIGISLNIYIDRYPRPVYFIENLSIFFIIVLYYNKYKKSHNVSTIWLFVGYTIFVLSSNLIINNFLIYRIPHILGIFNYFSWFYLLGRGILLAGFFVAFHKFKRSVEIFSQISPYSIFISLSILYIYFTEYLYSNSYDNYEIMYSLGLVVPFLITIVLNMKLYFGDTPNKKQPLSIRNFINIIATFLCLFILVVSTFIPGVESCTSPTSLYVFTIPSTLEIISPVRGYIENNQEIKIFNRSLLGNKSVVGTVYHDYVLITGVSYNSPAQKVGLREGDKVIAVNEEPVTTIEDFQIVIRANIGNLINLKIIRDNEPLIVRVAPNSEGEIGGVYISDHENIIGYITNEYLICK